MTLEKLENVVELETERFDLKTLLSEISNLPYGEIDKIIYDKIFYFSGKVKIHQKELNEVFKNCQKTALIFQDFVLLSLLELKRLDIIRKYNPSKQTGELKKSKKFSELIEKEIIKRIAFIKNKINEQIHKNHRDVEDVIFNKDLVLFEGKKYKLEKIETLETEGGKIFEILKFTIMKDNKSILRNLSIDIAIDSNKKIVNFNISSDDTYQKYMAKKKTPKKLN